MASMTFSAPVVIHSTPCINSHRTSLSSRPRIQRSSCSRWAMHEQTPPSPPITSIKTRTIDSSTGISTKQPSSSTSEIIDAQISLPNDFIASLNNIRPKRSQATASVFISSNLDVNSSNWLLGRDVVIFAHGFSQRPANYHSILSRLAVLGYIVIAPRVWLFDILLPWTRVESVGFFDSLQAKLQTALLIDIARCVQLADQGGARHVHTIGHSMGGAMLLAFGRYVHNIKKLSSVTLLAPAVSISTQTKLNPDVNRKGLHDLTSEDVANVPTLFLQGERDLVVKRKATKLVFQKIENIKQCIGFGIIKGGTHIGFEDGLDVDVPLVVILDQLLFKLVDFIFYTADFFSLHAKEQRDCTKAILQAFLKAVESDENVENEMNNAFSKENVQFEWGQKIMDRAELKERERTLSN